MDNCNYSDRCLNINKCYRCFNQALLLLPEDKQKKNKARVYDKKVSKGKESWKEFEQHTADLMNNIPKIKNAHRSMASGALWFQKGDVIDDILHIENKERSGKSLSGGDKSISIRRSWLDKAREEARSVSKIPCLPFRFKEDTHNYVIIELEDLASLVTIIKSYQIDGGKNE